MNPKESTDTGEEGSVTELIKTFRWIDCNSFKVVSRQGIEKIVDIRGGSF